MIFVPLCLRHSSRRWALVLISSASLGCSCQRTSDDDQGNGEESGQGTATSTAADSGGPQRCPEKRIEDSVLVQTDEELQALEGATYIQSLLIFRPVSTLEPLRCLERLDGELATGAYQSFPSLEPLRNLRSVPYLQLQSTEVDDLTPLAGLEQVDKIDLSFPKVTSLRGLEAITGGWVLIRKTSIEDLDGLGNFREGQLTLSDNTHLESFHGLDALERLEYLGITHSDALSTLVSVPKVPVERLVIDYNAGLVDLTGLEHLTSANVVQITHNQTLESLHGLDNLTELWSTADSPGHLLIDQNTVLRDFSGLDRLTRVDGYVEIKDLRQASIESMHGLEQLEHVSANLLIVGNPRLVSLQALRPDLGGSLRHVGLLEVRQNDNLPNCEAIQLGRAIRDAGGTLGGLFTMGNLEDDCPDVSE